MGTTKQNIQERLDRIGQVLAQMNRDDQMLDTLKAVVASADEEVRSLAGPFINWLFIRGILTDAVRIRLLVDERKGVDSLLKVLKDLNQTQEAAQLKQACKNAVDYMNSYVAHASRAPKTKDLSITALTKNKREIWRVYSRVYREQTGNESPAFEFIDRSWATAFERPWVTDPSRLWWNLRLGQE